MPQSSYEVIIQSVAVLVDTNGLPQAFMLAAPAGKKAVAGGVRDHITGGQGRVTVTGSYPNGDTWVFEIIGTTFDHTVDLFLIAASI